MRTYYYLPLKEEEKIENVEYFNDWYNCISRKGIGLYYDDYPRHRYTSQGFIGVMQFIPENVYRKTNYLNHSKGNSALKTIQLDSKDLFKWDNKYYLKEFEERLNTTVWKEYSEWKERHL